MVSFIPKKIGQQNDLGEELRRRRNNKNLSIEEVAKILQIRKEYLLALEDEDFDVLPSGIYGKNFLKKYANFLQIEPEKINEFIDIFNSDNEEENPFSQKVVKKRKFLIFPKIVRTALISLAVIACFLYLTFYFRNIISPPSLEITQPEKNIITQESSIVISGKTERNSEIKINDSLILADENGNFSELINLKKGLNTIEISAKKRYSKENIKTRQILVE